MAITATTTTGETVTITRDSMGLIATLTYADGRKAWQDYQYGAQQVRGTGITLSHEQWDALGEEYTARQAAQAASTPKPRGIAAKYAGTCKRSGRRYGKGARIEQTAYGWALVGTDVDLTYQMDRADSKF